jgi:hypothetical protein
MDHLEKFKQLKQSLEQMATEVVCLSEQIQRIREQLESIAPPRVDGEHWTRADLSASVRSSRATSVRLVER